MYKKPRNKNHKIVTAFFLLGLICSFFYEVHGEDELTAAFIRPKVSYKVKDRRDPFVQPALGRMNNSFMQVDIGALQLTGIIRNPEQATALFTTQTGPKFGYLFKNGQLFSENHHSISGITGEILNPKEVELRQNGNVRIFKLRVK